MLTVTLWRPPNVQKKEGKSVFSALLEVMASIPAGSTQCIEAESQETHTLIQAPQRILTVLAGHLLGRSSVVRCQVRYHRGLCPQKPVSAEAHSFSSLVFSWLCWVLVGAHGILIFTEACEI